MGGTIPRTIREKVIGQWIQGLPREEIAKENGIGVGTVTAIINDAKNQKEYRDIDLLRHVSTTLREESLELYHLGFAIRLKKIMEENDISDEQLENLALDFAVCCFKQKLSPSKFFESGYEAMYLAEKFGISVDKIPETIVQEKKLIDQLDENIQKLTLAFQTMEEKYAAIVSEIAKYGNEEQLIQRINKLKRHEKLTQNYKEDIKRLKEQLRSARRDAVVIEEARNELAALLSRCRCLRLFDNEISNKNNGENMQEDNNKEKSKRRNEYKFLHEEVVGA
jgi:hypothetical protein